MRFSVKFDTGLEDAAVEHVAVDWQDLIAQLEAEGILTQVIIIAVNNQPYSPPARDMEDIPF